MGLKALPSENEKIVGLRTLSLTPTGTAWPTTCAGNWIAGVPRSISAIHRADSQARVLREAGLCVAYRKRARAVQVAKETVVAQEN